MEKAWKKHGENSMVFIGKFPCFPCWGNCKNIPNESMESMESKTMESMGIHKNESIMGRMVFSSISHLIISTCRSMGRKHGKKAWEESMESMEKHGIYANEFTSLWFPGCSWPSWPLLAPW